MKNGTNHCRSSAPPGHIYLPKIGPTPIKSIVRIQSTGDPSTGHYSYVKLKGIRRPQLVTEGVFYFRPLLPHFPRIRKNRRVLLINPDHVV